MPAWNEPAAAASRPALTTSALPRRVRLALEAVHALLAQALPQHLGAAISDYEQQVARADIAPGAQRLQDLHQQRSAFLPHYLAALDAALAAIRKPPTQDAQLAAISFENLSLMDDTEMEQRSLISDIALRQEVRASMPLHLLGQRFGVLAATPAFDAERLPIGPHGLLRLAETVCNALHFSGEERVLLYRAFDRHVLSNYRQLAELLNETLAAQGVLRSLAFVPIRIRIRPPTAAVRAAAADRAGQDARLHTGWLGLPGAAASAPVGDEAADFQQLQELLSNRRSLIGRLRPEATATANSVTIDTAALLDALAALQPAEDEGGAGAVAPDLLELRQAALERLRQTRGTDVALARDQADTFELLAMLYRELEREVRRESPAAALLEQLRQPLLRVALRDRAFFVRPQHPARQLLGVVAESGARWLADDELDPSLVNQLQQAVEQIARKDDPATLQAALADVQGHLQALGHKAEVSERRHMEAARGREKLELAKRRAAETIAAELQDKRLPLFVRTLLNQAWADALTLTLLRSGEDSDDWRRMLETTRRIALAAGRDAGTDPELTGQIESALLQVGYHADDAASLARRLITGLAEDDDEAATRTELAMRMRARARLGEDTGAKAPALPPRTPEEQEAYDEVRVLPFGVWFEFAQLDGGRVRRRLSWFSTVTDNALFVNQRGQRVGEQSLGILARMLAHGEVQIVTQDQGRLIDRAWQSMLDALRSLAGRRGSAEANA